MSLASPVSEPVAPPPARAPLKLLDAALAQLLAHAAPLPAVETVATLDADGRVLAQGLLSSLDVPAHDNSAMDGYAVRCADWPDVAPLDATTLDTAPPPPLLPVSQRIAAGSNPQPLAPLTAARIFTGAPIPPGTDAVVMQEDCDALDGGVCLRQPPQPGQWIRRRGEDVTAGAVVLQYGARLTPASLGLAASIGFDKLLVAPRVRVALFSTGDELVMPGEVAPADMKPGAIYNANRFFLKALLQRFGCIVTDLGIVPDQLDATIAALKGASEQHDVILTSGGVSVGEEDHIKPAVQALGSLMLWQLAIKPGKPFAYGRVGTAHFIGLPGNPVASWVTFLLLVRPFLLRLQGAAELAPLSVALPAHFDWPKADKRREFLRARLNAAGGLELFANQSSSVLTSAVWADGLVDNPPGQTIAHGDMVQFMPFSGLMA
jgi:molybdopterin molybdotransferase